MFSQDRNISFSRMERKTLITGGNRSPEPGARHDRGPFWISAANYYLLCVFVAGIVFLLVLGVLHDGYDDTPWIAAGLSAAAFAGTLVIFREVVLRRIRQRAIAERRLSKHIRVTLRGRDDEIRNGRITIEQNAEMLGQIRAKSEAANVLGRVAEAHSEVFDLCEKYLSAASESLLNARSGSPRIPALRKGRRFAAGRHRYHMLRWAEIKAAAFTAEPSDAERQGRRVSLAGEALAAVDRAIAVYPEEKALADSKAVLDIFLLSARLRRLIDKAERADAAGNSLESIVCYREALSELQNSDVEFSEREDVLDRIHAEIGRISKLAGV